MIEGLGHKIEDLRQKEIAQLSFEETVRDKNDKLNSLLPHAFGKLVDLRATAIVANVMEKQARRRHIEAEEEIIQYYINLNEKSFVEKSRAYLREIDRAQKCDARGSKRKGMMKSTILHAMPQLFPRGILLKELKRQLDCMIMDEIKRDEALHSLLQNPITVNGGGDEDSLIYTFASEEDNSLSSDEGEDTIEEITRNVCIACQTEP